MGYGDTIREARTKLGWTIKEFIAKMTSDGITTISPAYVTRVEQYGEIPSPEMIIRMSEVLRLDLEQLIEAAKRSKLEIFKERLDSKYDEAVVLFRKSKSGRK